MILSVVGARPQFVKAAVVAAALEERGAAHRLVHTGQHYDDSLSDVFFRELGLRQPDHQLDVGSGSHGAQTAAMLEGLERVILEVEPAWVVLYGDTNSTLAGALAAAKLHVPVAHVEAGLRSFDRRMPEELNRVLTDHASDLLLAPTDTAIENLRKEGIPDNRVRLVGDVMYDAALHFRGAGSADRLEQLGVRSGEYILATAHRAANTDDPARLRAIFHGLARVARDTERPALVLLHPRTRAALRREGLMEEMEERLILSEPVGYLDMLTLESHARLVATDSGGVQKEAYFLGVPCVTLREETEWVELVESGWNRLVAPLSADAVADGIGVALQAPPQPPPAAGLFGGGRAGALIAEVLVGQPPEDTRQVVTSPSAG